jgi:hypothetical protein
MRNISQLHPELKKKVVKLQKECLKAGIKIKIGECVRTVAEQNALYAKGRNGVPGPIVTKAKGTDYRSMHQWGVAFDFFLDMDVDKDGKKSDDVFNNATKLFNKVGAIGKKLGLEWGGDWKSIKDLPHFQLPDWGSTATQLKKKYSTPEKFKETWDVKEESKNVKAKPNNTVTASKNPTEPARSKDKKYAKKYKVVAVDGLNLRTGAGSKKSIVTVIPKDSEVVCHGYYTNVGSDVWLFIQYGKYTGFVSKKYLK